MRLSFFARTIMPTTPFSGSIVATVTPMDSGAQLDRGALEKLLRRQLAAGTGGVVIAGTTGEGAVLSEAMFEACMAIARDVVSDSDVALIAGLGSPSTDKCKAQLRAAERCGASALLCVTPYYLKTTQAGLEAHFRALADLASVPVILYNVPGRTANDLLPETTIRLSGHPNIVAIKEAVPDMGRIQMLVGETSGDFAVLSGDDESACQAMLRGASGVISVTANVAPEPMARLARLAMTGEVEQASKLDEQLAPLHRAMMMEPNPIPVKAALAQLGLLEEHLALPLVPATSATKMTLSELVADLPATWTE